MHLEKPTTKGDDKDEFRHVGFSAKKSHTPAIVKANPVWAKKIKLNADNAVSEM